MGREEWEWTACLARIRLDGGTYVCMEPKDHLGPHRDAVHGRVRWHGMSPCGRREDDVDGLVHLCKYEQGHPERHECECGFVWS